MKKRILLFSMIAGIAYFSLTSSTNGAGNAGGYDCTGAETANGNGLGCSRAGSCHSAAATAGITVNLELDSAGISVTHYLPGTAYTVKITGTNTTATTLPKFGFQVACIKGATAVASPINAGTWGTVSGTERNTPSGVNFTCNLVEHSVPIAATTAGGATGGTYVATFPWTAPVVGTGTVSIWGALNAVNNNGGSDGDSWNTAHIALTEAVSRVGVAAIGNNFSVSAYPNPVSNNLGIQLNDTQEGNYTVHAFDLSGRCVTNENVVVTGKSQLITINTGSWAPGLYQVVLQKDTFSQVVRVVKNL